MHSETPSTTLSTQILVDELREAEAWVTQMAFAFDRETEHAEQVVHKAGECVKEFEIVKARLRFLFAVYFVLGCFTGVVFIHPLVIVLHEMSPRLQVIP